MPQIHCPNCQHPTYVDEIVDGQLICRSCGKSISISGDFANPATVSNEVTVLTYAGKDDEQKRSKSHWWFAVVLLILVLPVFIGVGLIALGQYNRNRSHMRPITCASNLRGIALALYIYAQDEPNFEFPDDINKVIAAGNAVPKQFQCPQSPAGIQCYFYVVGLSAESDPAAVLMFENPINHQGDGGNVLYVDGHVAFVRNPAYQAIVDEQLATSP